MKSNSGRWNAENAERVREARARYRKKQAEERERRSKLVPFELAQEDLESLLTPLDMTERRSLLEWATTLIEQDD